jgi:ATP-binding protein involved in chromosome partitioning
MTLRTYRDVVGADGSGVAAQVAAQRARVDRRLATVGRIVAILSGKGGVGKSFVTAALARLAAARWPERVGVLDADLRSPTVARMLGAAGPLRVTPTGVVPALGSAGVRVVSTDLLLEDERPLAWREPSGDAFAWRGALEAGVLREFLGDVAWGELEVLLVDLPPGADGGVDLAHLAPGLAALVVTIPSEEARRSVARAVRAARDAGIRLLGVVENMSGYRCGECAGTGPLFAGGAGAALAEQFGIPLLARVPFVAPRAGEPAAAVFDPAGAARVLEALG